MTLVKIENIVKDYRLPKQHLFRKAPVFRALHGIDLEIEKGGSYGIVGESGCGKSTLARIVMALDRPTHGAVYFQGKDLFKTSVKELTELRRHFQMVFQDPYGSLNPRKKILSIVGEPLETLEKGLNKAARKDKVCSMLNEVGLNPGCIEKYPHEFSGGQRQRIAIARALITNPSLIVADESVSALDVSVQAQVLNLIMDLQEKYNLTLMFISHDLSVVEFVTEKVAVIYLGRIVEQGYTRDIFNNPLHPYTQLLLRAIPSVDPSCRKKREKRVRPENIIPLHGCPFIGRCDRATENCKLEIPQLTGQNQHLVACHNP